MSKLTLWIVSVLLPFLGGSQEFKKINSIEEQLEDFKIFKTTLLECHIGIYDYNDSLSINEGLDYLENKLATKPMMRIEQLALFSKYVSSLKCIHTGVYQKEMTFKSLDAKYKLPFDLYFVNGELRSKNNYTSGQLSIEKNDQILAINQEPILNLKDSLYPFISSDGNNTSHKNQTLKHRFLFFFFYTNKKKLISNYNIFTKVIL